MNTKMLFGILAVFVLLVGGFFFLAYPVPPTGAPTATLTRDEATNAVIALHSELAAYKTTSLPPSFIETKEAPVGWYVAFIQRGSGLPGILNAQCYHVKNEQEVTATGQYTRHDNVEADTIALEDCTPSNVSVSQTGVLPYGNVTLKLGELAIFKNISIRSIAIVEDSRCPVDVQCIQAGTVRVKIEVASGMGTSTSIVKLGVAFTTEGERITLTAAIPENRSQAPIAVSDYRLTFNVVPQTTPVVNNPSGQCYIGGCSAQLCTDQPDVASTCEYTATYACYKSAKCERQVSGLCGWTQTPQLAACLRN